MDEQDAIVGALYRAALEPQRWAGALRAVAKVVGADTFNLIGWDPVAQRPTFNHFERDLFAREFALYEEHYGALDPRRALATDLLPGSAVACNQHFDERFVSGNEFYQDYLIPNGMRYVLGGCVLKEPHGEVSIGLLRANGRPPYGEAELRQLTQLLPHVRRAVELYVQEQRRGAPLLAASTNPGALAGPDAAALEAVSIGLVAVDANGKVLFANRLAESWLSEQTVIALRGGRLRAVGHADDQALGAGLVRSAAEQVSCNLLLGDGDASLDRGRISVTTLPVRGPLRAGLPATATVLCLLSPLDRRRFASGRQLMELFGLTAAEARLARALGMGMSLDDYARVNDLRLPTVKTQLRSVFAKTGCDRQAGLVRLLSAVPAVREPRPT